MADSLYIESDATETQSAQCFDADEENFSLSDSVIFDSSPNEVYHMVTAIISSYILDKTSETNKENFVRQMISDCQANVTLEIIQDNFIVSGSLCSIIIIHLQILKALNISVKATGVVLDYLKQFISFEKSKSKCSSPVVTRSGRIVKKNNSSGYTSYSSEESDDEYVAKASTMQNKVTSRGRGSGRGRGRGRPRKVPMSYILTAVAETELNEEEPSDKLQVVEDAAKSDAKRKFACTKCSYAASRRLHLDNHMKVHLRKNKIYKCHQCSFTTMTKSQLTRHGICHSRKTVKCSHCSYITTTLKALYQHAKVRHFRKRSNSDDSLKQRCSLCSFSTKKKGVLDKHMRRHSSLPFDCPLCGYQTKYKHHMKRHVTIVHSNVRPFLCDDCGTSFKRKDNLELHKRSHIDPANGGLHSCLQCPRKFITQSRLNAHMTVHLTNRAFLCDHCGAAFKTRCVQKKHIQAIHLQPHSYKCSLCPKKFSHAFSLQRHLSTHKGILDDDFKKQVMALSGVEKTSNIVAADPKQILNEIEKSQMLALAEITNKESAASMTRDESSGKSEAVEKEETEAVPTITLHIQTTPSGEQVYIPVDDPTASSIIQQTLLPIVIQNDEAQLQTITFTSDQSEQILQLQREQIAQLQKEQEVLMQREQILQLQQLKEDRMLQAHEGQDQDESQVESSDPIPSNSFHISNEVADQLTPDQLTQLTANILAAAQLQVPVNLSDIETVLINQTLALNQVDSKPSETGDVPLSSLQVSLLDSIETGSATEQQLLDSTGTSQCDDINVDSMLQKPSNDNPPLQLIFQ